MGVIRIWTWKRLTGNWPQTRIVLLRERATKLDEAPGQRGISAEEGIRDRPDWPQKSRKDATTGGVPAERYAVSVSHSTKVCLSVGFFHPHIRHTNVHFFAWREDSQSGSHAKAQGRKGGKTFGDGNTKTRRAPSRGELAK